MTEYPSMGEAVYAAMAHNARMAADLARRSTVRAEAAAPEPPAMTTPLSDTRLAEPAYGVVFDRPDADRCYAWGPFSGFDAAARFAEFVQAEIDPARVLPWAEAEVLPGVRLLDAVTELLNWRVSVALPKGAEVDRLRELMAPAELTNWAEQLQSADLTPHPAFAWCSTTSGYEAAFQVATTGRLTDAARERLLAELQLAFDETVRRFLGYRPAAAPSEPTCGVLNPKVAATCTEPNDHPSPIHRDAFGNTWTRRDGEHALGAGQ